MKSLYSALALTAAVSYAESSKLSELLSLQTALIDHLDDVSMNSSGKCRPECQQEFGTCNCSLPPAIHHTYNSYLSHEENFGDCPYMKIRVGKTCITMSEYYEIYGTYPEHETPSYHHESYRQHADGIPIYKSVDSTGGRCPAHCSLQSDGICKCASYGSDGLDYESHYEPHYDGYEHSPAHYDQGEHYYDYYENNSEAAQQSK